jgi:S1-C subfamily serine protease
MRIDVAVNGGNSGGALFNDDGEVIGIVNAKMSDSTIDNIGYAIPSNVAKNVADNIIYYDSLDSSNDCVKRAIIGVTPSIKEAYTEFDSETGRVHKMETVHISEIVSGSLADGKLKKGDVLNSVTIDGVTYEITRTFDVFDAMLTVRVTDSFSSDVSFNITRDGTVMDVAIDISGVTLENS